MGKEINVAIVEDDAYVRNLLSQFIKSQNDMSLVYQAGSVEESLSTIDKILKSKSPSDKSKILDVLIQDIGLPGMSGLEALKIIKSKLPNTEILMFTVFDDAERVFKAFCAGASGYLLKNTRLADMRKAILDINQGMAAMSPSIAKKVVNHFRPVKHESELTPTEFHVVELLTEGMSYKMIADRMQISINTIRTHIRNIYRKLHVNSKSEVIAKKLRGEI